MSIRHRAERVCDGSTKWQEIEHLRQMFRANEFPEAVIKRNLRDQPTPSYTPQTSETPSKLLLLPYVPGLSKKIERAC